MAQRRAKSNVLSAQELTVRRKQLNVKKAQAPSGAKRLTASVVLAALSILALLSIASYQVGDRVGPGFDNWAGAVGHAMAELMRGAFGLASLSLPVFGLMTARALFSGESTKRPLSKFFFVSLMLLSTSTFFAMSMPLVGAPHGAGGWVGRELAFFAQSLFSKVGSYVVLIALFCISLIVATEIAFVRLVYAAAELVKRTWNVMWKLIDESQRIQEAWLAKQKERKAKARAEHDAFIKALETEEEELAALEREAAEASLAMEREEAIKEAQPQKTVTPRKTAAAATARHDPAWAQLLGPVDAKGQPAPKKTRTDAQSKELVRAEPNLVMAGAKPMPPSAPLPRAKKTAQPPATALPPPASTSGPAPTAIPGPSTYVPRTAMGATTLPLDGEFIAPPAGTSPEQSALALVASPALTKARTPVIVEPKAPPKPTKKEVFQFNGNRTAFTTPPIDLLEANTKARTQVDKETFLSTAEKLRSKLADFGIIGEVVEIRPGPVVTMYEFLPGPGIKVSKIASLADDLAMAMEAMRVRIVAPIPGKGVVGIEVPNRDRETVYLKEIAEQDAFHKSASKLTMCLGKDIEGMPYVFDLAKAPHLLMAGTTGSGKSVAVNAMIMSILLKSTPEEVRFIMVDPKMLELSVYEGIPHLLLPVVTDPRKASLALQWAVDEMTRRYKLLAEAGVRNISSYNQLLDEEQQTRQAKRSKAKASAQQTERKLTIIDVSADGAKTTAPRPSLGSPSPNIGEDPRTLNSSDESTYAPTAEEVAALNAAKEELEDGQSVETETRQKLPYIVVIIDELADLMMVASKEVETSIARLAQMARAAGIHLMVATQRPSTDVVTGVIKANFPTRISFMLRSKPDSMTILGTVGAEALLGMGDMLIMPPTSAHMQRVHGCFVSDGEIKRAVEHLKVQGKPVYDESILKPREEGESSPGDEDELSDELFDQAVAIVSEMKSISISMLQRRMRIGYNRAARMIERMEREGMVGSADGAKPREVLLRPLGQMGEMHM